MTRPAPVQDRANFVFVVDILVAKEDLVEVELHDIHARKITRLTNGGLADLELSKSG